MGVNFFSILEASFYSTFRIIFISFCGFLLVKFNIINKERMKGVAEMTANFLIPCLSVAEICKSFDIKEYTMWLPILMYCILNVGMGYFIGEIICYTTKSVKEIRRLILIVCMFSNSTSMQLIYIDSLGAILAQMIHSSEKEATSKGYVIVLLYTIFVNFLRWSIGYNLMKPDSNTVDRNYLKKEDSKLEASIELKSNSYSPDKKAMKILNVTGVNEEDTENHSVLSSAENKNFQSCLKLIKEGVNMPFIAGVAAILLSSIPIVNTFFSDPNSVGFKLIVESCQTVGKCVSTFVILTLGLNFSITLKDNEENSEPLDKKIIILVLMTKAIIFPFLGLCSIWLIGYKANILTNPLLCFLLLTNFCTPTAINMITIAILNKFQVKNLSKLLIYQYIMGTVTVTIWTAIYLNLFL